MPDAICFKYTLQYPTSCGMEMELNVQTAVEVNLKKKQKEASFI